VKSLGLYAAVAFALVARVSAQGPDPFDGTWRLNAAKTQTVWAAQPQPKSATPQAQGTELMTMHVADGTMQYKVEYAGGKTASYTAKFNDAKWQDIRGDAENGIAAVTLVKINDRLHYWVTRTRDGQFGGLIQRRIAEDGKSLTSVRVGTDGYVQYVRVFDRQ
jgi:hypothetical protein